jgi:hypothetical protein
VSTTRANIVSVQRPRMRPRERLAAVCSLVPEAERAGEPLCQLLAHLGVTIPPDPNAEPRTVPSCVSSQLALDFAGVME